MEELKTIVVSLAESIEKYESKPTKAESKRIRALTLQLNKLGPRFRAESVAADKVI